MLSKRQTENTSILYRKLPYGGKNKMFNFDRSTDRQNSNSEKYKKRLKLFGTNDITPLWVADMDIDTPSFIVDAGR